MLSKTEILIDIGSSTVKVYAWNNKKLTALLQRTIGFKDGFDPEHGLAEDKKQLLFELIKEVKSTYADAKIKVFATALYRKMTNAAQIKWIDEFYAQTGLYFNIIAHDLENFYLETALVGKANLAEPMLLINIGGGSTELVVVFERQAIEKQNLDLGVGSILTQFPNINEPLSQTSLENLTAFIRSKLPRLENATRIAFYTGGELTYMRKAKYNLRKNLLFKDADHPVMIDIVDFRAKNRAVFDTVTMSQLQALMPENPAWMAGARPCSALAQAICEQYGIEILIPSDANLITGMVRQGFRTAVLSGSFRKHLEYILKIKQQLEETGVEILSPRFNEPTNPGAEFVVFAGEEGATPLELERYHLSAIGRADVLIVCDPQGYVGASAMLEIGYANALNKLIIFTEEPEEFMLKTLPAEIGL